MSKDNWESGTIVIPRASWARFKSTLVTKHNEQVDRELALIKSLFAVVKTQSKGKRNCDLRGLVRNEAAIRTSGYGGYSHPKYPFKLLGFDDTVDLLVADLVKYECSPVRDKPAKQSWVSPKASIIPKVKSNAILFTADLGTIKLDQKNHSVTWRVSQNNHAVESSRDSFMGDVLFSALSSITWTRNTGGEIVGNDEYNTDGEDDGQGANYVTQRFGPLGNDERTPHSRSRSIKPSASARN